MAMLWKAYSASTRSDLQLTIQAHAAVRRMALSVVALHVAANVVDYYITKYAAKAMEQLLHTEQTHWASHNEIPVFLSRPLYQISQCNRVLLGAKAARTRAAPVDIICVDVALSGRAMGTASESAGRS